MFVRLLTTTLLLLLGCACPTAFGKPPDLPVDVTDDLTAQAPRCPAHDCCEEAEKPDPRALLSGLCEDWDAGAFTQCVLEELFPALQVGRLNPSMEAKVRRAVDDCVEQSFAHCRQMVAETQPRPGSGCPGRCAACPGCADQEKVETVDPKAAVERLVRCVHREMRHCVKDCC